MGKTQKNLVARLKELRKIHHITQEQFAERTGISYKYYQAVETGVKKELRISTIERLADAYGIEVSHWKKLWTRFMDCISKDFSSSKPFRVLYENVTMLVGQMK